MSKLFRFSGAARRDPAIDAWMHQHSGELGRSHSSGLKQCATPATMFESYCTTVIQRRAYMMRHSGTSTPFERKLMSGSFVAPNLPIPSNCSIGTGKFMRHVKLRPDRDVDAAALEKLIATAYTDMKRRLDAELPR
jgi:hypothetical protein